MIQSKKKDKTIEATQVVHGKGEHILLIDDDDDDELILKMEKKTLEFLGYKITTRTSSIEALELFKSCPDHFDLIITDMTMPNMTGEKVAFEIKKIRKEIPIIICTGFSDKMSLERSKLLGFEGFLMKPVIISELSKLVHEILEKKRHDE